MPRLARAYARSESNSISTVHKWGGAERFDDLAVGSVKESIDRAAFLLQQGCGLRPPGPDTYQWPRTYKFYHSIYFDLLGLCVLSLQLFLCFTEPGSLFLPSKSQNASSYLSLQESLYLETFCVIIHIFSVGITYVGPGFHARTAGSGFIWLIILSLFSIAVIAVSDTGDSMNVCGLFRIYRILRPFFAFIYFDNPRRLLKILLHSFNRIWYILLFGTFAIVGIFAIFVFALYNPHALAVNTNLKDIKDDMTHFATFPSTMAHILWFSLGLNNPTVWSPVFAKNVYHCFFWMILLLFLFTLLGNITLSMIWNGYEQLHEAETERVQTDLVRKIQETYFVLSSVNDDAGIPRNAMKQVFILFQFQQSNSLNEEHFDIYWDYAAKYDRFTDDKAHLAVHGDAVMSASGLAHFCAIWFSTLELKRREYSWFFRAFNAPLFVGSRVSLVDAIVCVISVTQSTLLFIRVYAVANAENNDSPGTQWIVYLMSGSPLMWLTEMVARLFALGVADYIKSRHMVNGMLTVIITMLGIIGLFQGGGGDFLRPDDNLEVLRLVFVLICIGDIIPFINNMVHSTYHALNEIMIFLFVIMLLQVSFALLGQELFANLKEHVAEHKDEEGSNAAWSGLGESDQEINFSTFGRAYNLVMVIFGVNMVPGYMMWYQDQMEFVNIPVLRTYGPALVGTYFVGLIVFQYMFITNLVTAVFLMAYESYAEEMGFGESGSVVAAVISQVQDSADRISPGRYQVIKLPNYGNLHVNVLLDDEMQADDIVTKGATADQ